MVISFFLALGFIENYSCVYAADTDTFSEKLINQTVAIPLHYSNYGRMLVPVELDGHHLQLILDTGSSSSILWKDVATGLAKMSNIKIKTIIAGGAKVTDTLCKISEMHLGGLVFHNVSMKATAEYNDNGQEEAAGFLGNDILKNFVVTIDYRTKELLLANPHKFLRPTNGVVVPFEEKYFRVPFVNLSLDGKSNLSAIIDTGSSGNYAPESSMKSLLKNPLRISEQISGVTQNLNTGYVRLKSLELGSFIDSNPIFVIAPTNKSTENSSDFILIGSAFLSMFRVTIDYHNKEIILEPYGHITSAIRSWEEGNYYLRNGNCKRAIEAFNKVITIEPELRPTAYNGRGCAYRLLGKYRKAIDDYNKAISLDSTYSYPYANRAIVNYSLNNNRQVIEDLTKSMALGLRKSEDYRLLSQARNKLGDNKAAIEDCNMSIKLDPESPLAYIARSSAYANLRQYQYAIDDCSKAIELDPINIDAYVNRANLYEKLGNRDLALQDRKIIQQLGRRVPKN